MKFNKRILVICPYPVGVAAGQRLKYEQYFDDWKSEGYEIVVSSFMSMPMWKVVYTHGNYIGKIKGTVAGYFKRCFDIFRLPNFDLVYIHMWVTPFGGSIFERIFRSLSARVVFDIEDNVFLERRSDLNWLGNILKGRGKLEYLIKSADHVVTSSPYLNDFCLRLNRKKACTYISSSVNTDLFFPCNKYVNDGKVTIGWTGTFSSRVYLDMLRPVFVELRKRIEYKLLIIGNFSYELPGIDLEVVQWKKDTEVSDLQRIDIGVYPLAQDEWVMGKSGLKAIQYMAFGLPTVATNVGTTKQIITHMTNGLLVDSDAEWIDALELMAKDASLREFIGKNARQSVLQKYSCNVVKNQYLSIINNLQG